MTDCRNDGEGRRERGVPRVPQDRTLLTGGFAPRRCGLRAGLWASAQLAELGVTASLPRVWQAVGVRPTGAGTAQ